MFSLMQQTAPTAVETTTMPAGAATTVVVTDPVAPTPPLAAQTYATDSTIVPDASGVATAPVIVPDGQGHLPSDVIVVHPTVTVDTLGTGVPGADAPNVVAHGADAASAGMPQLDFTSFGNQIFWLLVALVLIYLILSRVALPRIGRILGDRQGLMTADLASAEDFKRKAREAEAAYDKALADARTEAQKIVAANKADIDAELATAIARADAEIAARTQESERRISEIRASAATDARTVARDVAAELVRTFGGTTDGASIVAAVDARIKGAAL